MTIDEAIEHAEEVAEEQEKLYKRYDDASGYTRSHNEDIRTSDAKKCEKCADEHRQLAGWLKELKQLRKQTKKGHWINKSHKSGCGITFAISKCTCCGKNTFFDCDELLYRYCPNCGAEMESEE